VVGEGRGEEVVIERIVSSQSPDKVWVSVPHRTALGEMPGGGRVGERSVYCAFLYTVHTPHR
jgi:hypothetical protein